MKFLLINPDPVDSLACRKILESAGFQVILAENEHKARDAMVEDDIQVMIFNCDKAVPGYLELIKLAASGKAGRGIFVLLLASRENDVAAGLTAGADDYLLKPYSDASLQARASLAIKYLSLKDEIQELRSHAERLAIYDPLTGLMNRSAVYQMARAELERARRAASPYSLIVMDLDNFESINDQFGSDTGDQVLRLVAQAIRDKSRPYDEVGRLSGDKFILVLPAVAGTDAERIAGRILGGVISIKVIVETGDSLYPAISAGVASVNRVRPAIDMLDKLIQQAEAGLLQAKQEGGNQVRLNFI
ncbi:MAG: diguanylate cyclase [Chloroflexi bacterium]|nr:diguanylate cyclase [Chloroflexota bacterium]